MTLVRPWDLDVSWQPNAPDAVLVSDDGGRTVLALRAHPDDADQRSVVLTWAGCRWAVLGDPNDEALAGHDLAGLGLAEILWGGTVDDSALIPFLERRNAAHPRHDPAAFQDLVHHVLPLKECLVEVVSAGDPAVTRAAGTTLEACLTALR